MIGADEAKERRLGVTRRLIFVLLFYAALALVAFAWMVVGIFYR